MGGVRGRQVQATRFVSEHGDSQLLVEPLLYV
jgi:hypothetical protein